jgi:ppGpp synthetase/RelA/SpoT-type nucleotidyltranferase
MPARDNGEIALLKKRIIKFRENYDEWKQPANDVRKRLQELLSQLMDRNGLVPAVLESRIKPKNTAARKIEEASDDNPLALIDDPRDLYDFVGLRLVFLLKDEVAKAKTVICATFPTDSPIVKGEELKPNEFGYRSIHLHSRIPKAWLTDPVYTDFDRLTFEIQLRTLSEHNYAVASRVLSYRQTEAVPPPVQRSLLRLAAILELVDLEVERVFQEKMAYAAKATTSLNPDEALNVDLIIKILDKELPKEHRVPNDRYAALFDELTKNGVNSAGQLLELIKKFRDAAFDLNKIAAESSANGDPGYPDEYGKAGQGIYFSHVGLVWNMLPLRNRA